jgi:hypothetical protein
MYHCHDFHVGWDYFYDFYKEIHEASLAWVDVFGAIYEFSFVYKVQEGLRQDKGFFVH